MRLDRSCRLRGKQHRCHYGKPLIFSGKSRLILGQFHRLQLLTGSAITLALLATRRKTEKGLTLYAVLYRCNVQEIDLINLARMDDNGKFCRILEPHLADPEGP